MKDVERGLREMFDRRGRDVLDVTPPAAPVIRRTRWHQAGTIAVACVAAAAAALVPIVGMRLRDGAEQRVVPATTVDLPQAPAGFRAAALPYASIAYPEDWYLLDTSRTQPIGDRGHRPVEAVPGPVLQLANFDPDVPRSPRCMAEPDSIPEDGVLLTVGIAAEGEHLLGTPGEWPASLEPYPDNGEPVCAQMREQATWRAPSGVLYWASAGWGRSAAQEDVDALHRAFESLLFPPTDQQWIHSLGVREGRTPRVVLDSTTYGHDVLTFVAYLELVPIMPAPERVLSVGVESSGPFPGTWTVATSPHTGSDPDEPVAASLSVIGEDAALLDGVISPEVSRVEVRTESGDAVPMHVDPLPASLGTDRYVWALVPGAGDRSTVVGYDRDGDLIGNPIYPVGGDQTIATGTEAGNPWTLSLTHDNTGWGLRFLWDREGGGGGGGVDLGDKVFGSILTGGTSWNIHSGWSKGPEVAGVVTSKANRVELQLVDGGSVPASVYPLPDIAFGGGASAFVLFIPDDALVQAGDLVAYDEKGQVLGRQYAANTPVMLFPEVVEQSPPDAVDAMEALRLAGAVAQRYFFEHDSWARFDPAAASAISDAVTYNTSSTAVVGEVSLRVAGKDSMVLATRTPSGDVYSACFDRGPSYAMVGRNDTSDPSACSNGSLNPPLPTASPQ
jgi:hypothetical protein